MQLVLESIHHEGIRLETLLTSPSISELLVRFQTTRKTFHTIPENTFDIRISSRRIKIGARAVVGKSEERIGSSIK